MSSQTFRDVNADIYLTALFEDAKKYSKITVPTERISIISQYLKGNYTKDQIDKEGNLVKNGKFRITASSIAKTMTVEKAPKKSKK